MRRYSGLKACLHGLAAEEFGRFRNGCVGGLYPVDPGGEGAFAAFGEEGLDGRSVAADDGFDGAVGAVADPAAETGLAGAAYEPGAVAYALDAAGDHEVSGDLHGRKLRPFLSAGQRETKSLLQCMFAICSGGQVAVG